MLPKRWQHRHGSRGEVTTGLEPLDGELSEENRRLSEALRALFSGLKTSVRRYAARRHRDPGTISRYLNGKRIPPWEFVLDLMSDAADGHGGPTEETLDHLRGLHRAALETSRSPQHAIQLLQDQLADNDRRARQWATYQETLQQALQDRQHRIGDLEMQMRTLQAGHQRDIAEAASTIARYEEGVGSLREERDRLKEEVEDLKEELAHAKEQGLLYEQKCHDLERQLEDAETSAGDDGEAVLGAEQEERQRAAEAALRVQVLEAQLREAQDRLRAQERRAAGGEQDDGVTLIRGGNLSLTKEAPGLTAAVVGLGWDVPTPTNDDERLFALDASALLLSTSGMVSSDENFVFFNNLKSPDGSVEHTGENAIEEGQDNFEEIKVNLAAVPADVARIVFTLSIYDAENRRQSFGQVRSAHIWVLNQADGQRLVGYHLEEDTTSTETAMVLGELYRYGPEWKFRAVGQGVDGGLRGIAAAFGVNV